MNATERPAQVIVDRDHFLAARKLADQHPLPVLLMAAMRKGDELTTAALRRAFPYLAETLDARAVLPGGRLPSEVPRPVECSNCTTSYDDCTTQLRKISKCCCGSCYVTATHKQNAWESVFGSKLTTEIDLPEDQGATS